MFKVSIPGLRDAQGRFASMRNGGLLALANQKAEELATRLEEIYQNLAPRQSGNFAASISGSASQTAEGFGIEVSTEQGDLARWFREGTGIFGPRGERITPVNGKALAFDWMGQHWVLASIAGMPANPWQAQADAEALVTAREYGNQIGRQVIQELGDRG